MPCSNSIEEYSRYNVAAAHLLWLEMLMRKRVVRINPPHWSMRLLEVDVLVDQRQNLVAYVAVVVGFYVVAALYSVVSFPVVS